MSFTVACCAERNEVFFRVFAGVAAEFHVVDLQLTHGSAALAPPFIPLKDLVAQLFVGVGV
jgi:hypothetical protein